MNNYNLLIHYADFRKAVVSEVPDDIYLDELKLDDEQKELIITGLPMVRDCIVSIYDDIIEYASNVSLALFNSSIDTFIIVVIISLCPFFPLL